MNDIDSEKIADAESEAFDEHLAAIGERYEDPGFFSRLAAMKNGLSKPHSSGEYKRAVQEVQRLKAPLFAIVFPALVAVILFVVTAVNGKVEEVINIQVARVEDPVEEIEPEQEPPEPDVPMDVDVEVDVVNDIATDVVTETPQSPSPGTPNTVAFTKSPVTFIGIKGSPNPGHGGVDGSGFGSRVTGNRAPEGALIGTIVDFKLNATGDTRDGYANVNSWMASRTVQKPYWDDLKALLESDFSSEKLAEYNVPKHKVALTHIFIKRQPAAKGPEAFGVSDTVQPRAFCVIYRGKIRTSKAGRFRLHGYFDDVLLVRLDKKVILESEWANNGDAPGLVTGWRPSDRNALRKVRSPQRETFAQYLIPSDWFEMEPNRDYEIDIVVGECPGGSIGGLVLIEEEGKHYGTTSFGIDYPLFFTRKPSGNLQDELSAQDYYKVNFDGPRFNARTYDPKKLIDKSDTRVEVDI